MVASPAHPHRTMDTPDSSHLSSCSVNDFSVDLVTGAQILSMSRAFAPTESVGVGWGGGT